MATTTKKNTAKVYYQYLGQAEYIIRHVEGLPAWVWDCKLPNRIVAPGGELEIEMRVNGALYKSPEVEITHVKSGAGLTVIELENKSA